MIRVEKFIFNDFEENTYLLINDKNECIVIDAGMYSEKEFSDFDHYLSVNKLKITYLLLTHGHIDHVLGTRYLSKKYNLAVYHHPDEKKLIEMAPTYGGVWGISFPELPDLEAKLTEDFTLSFGTSNLRFIHLPGHSTGHVGIFSEQNNFIFVGDVLFKGSIGRTDLPGGNYDTLMDSIVNKLLPLGDHVVAFPGHGDATTLGDERKNNPFITEFLNNFNHGG